MEGLHAPVSENLVGISIRERHPTVFKELVYSLIILLFLSEKLTLISPQTTVDTNFFHFPRTAEYHIAYFEMLVYFCWSAYKQQHKRMICLAGWFQFRSIDPHNLKC